MSGLGEAPVLRVRPQVPMGYLDATPAVVALGLAEALERAGRQAFVRWPDGLVDEAGRVTLLRGHAALDEGGVLVEVSLEAADGGPAVGLPDEAEGVVAERVERWSAEVRRTRGAGGPWAPFLSDYFDHEPRLGRLVDVVYPNGRVWCRGTFAGLDVWGRATVTLAEGGQVEFSSAEATVRLAQ